MDSPRHYINRFPELLFSHGIIARATSSDLPSPTSAKELATDKRLPRLARIPNALQQCRNLGCMCHAKALYTSKPFHNFVSLPLVLSVATCRKNREHETRFCRAASSDLR
jgi:hypothetical protein